MKPLITTLLVVCVAVIAGAIVYLNGHKGSSADKPIADIPANQPGDTTPRENAPVTPPPAQLTVAPMTNPPVQVAAMASAASPATPDDSTNTVLKLAKALLTAKSAKEKHDLFEQLRQSGQLDAAITDLKQMATDNPNDPEIPTTIGEAQLNEIRAIKEDGTGSEDQMGILAMQADQEFDAALKIDPQNWEAQLVKDSSMYYWPANPQRDGQVVQSLTGLIDQQEKMPSNPDFAQTYLLLGNEYQKIGQPDKATATWQLGAQEFPNNSALQQKLAGQ
jgi:tetratricopeptide (TPR) repeat protein